MRFENIGVYILSNQRRGKLYVGVTANLTRRIWEHKSMLFKGYSSKYGLGRLVYYESSTNMSLAIQRQKQIKGLGRWKKINIIENVNPEWNDLYHQLRILNQR